MPEETKIPNNSEIDKALKEFEAKQAEQIPKPLEVPATPSEAPKISETLTPNISEIDQALKQYEAKYGAEEIPKTPEAIEVSEIPKMVGLVMKWSGGAIKEQRQAEYVLLGLVVLMFALSLYFFFGGSSNSPQTSPEQLEQMQNMMSAS